MKEINYLYSHSYDYFLDPKNKKLKDYINLTSNHLFQIDKDEILNLPREIQKLIVIEFLKHSTIPDFESLLLPYLDAAVFKEILKENEFEKKETYRLNLQSLKRFISSYIVIWDATNQSLSIDGSYFYHDELKTILNSLSLEKKKEILHLNLINSPFIDLSFLSHFQSLISLNLDESLELASLEGIENCQKLEDLSLSKCRNIKDLHPLQSLTALKKLDLNECSKITNVQVLSKLKNLHSLSLNYCFLIKNFKFLFSLMLLEELNLRGLKNLTSADFLLNFTKLKKLDISYTQVKHVAIAALKPDLVVDMEGCYLEEDHEEESLV